MADLFIPRTWADGEEVDAVNFANRLENGVQALDLELDRQTDRIDALYATGGPGTLQAPSGPVASRPFPAAGTLFFDTSLTPPRLIAGTGSTWVEADGTALPGGGSGTAPQNLTAVVQAGGTIGAIALSWDPVPSATFYTLYELQSPGGVSGATTLTTTNTTRTPTTARNYEYWVTATVSSIESAASNHVQALLPFSGASTTADPSTFLNINGKGTGDGGWWNLGIGYEDGHKDITPTELQDGFVDTPYYTMNDARTAVQFQVFMNGGRTSTNTKYPRSELREYEPGSTSTKASWDGGSGHHIMRYKYRVMHMADQKPEVVGGQMHDDSDDTLQIHITGDSATGPETWRLKLFGSTVTTVASGVALGQEVAIDIDLNDGDLVVKADGVTKYTGHPGFGDKQYFKIGDYPQQNSRDQDNPSSEYSRIEVRDLFVSHS